MSKRLVVVVALLGAASAGCAAEQHLAPHFGASARAAFTRQAASPPDAVPADPVTGLDSQEAAIVADGYRRGLAPKGQKAEEEPILFVAPPPKAGSRAVLPPPSVPKEK